MPVTADLKDLKKLKDPRPEKLLQLDEDLFGITLKQGSYHCLLTFRIEDKTNQEKFIDLISRN